MLAYVVHSKPWPPLEVPHFDGFDQCGYNGVVQACIVEVSKLVGNRAFIEAVGMCGGWDV